MPLQPCFPVRFLGSSPGFDPVYQTPRRRSAGCSPNAASGWCTVAATWAMGTLSGTVMRAGGEVVGVIPQALLVAGKGQARHHAA